MSILLHNEYHGLMLKKRKERREYHGLIVETSDTFL